MKKKLSLFLAIIMMLSVLAGCGGGDQPQTPAEEMDIAYYAYNSEPILNWDPSVMFSNGIIVLNNVYETLLKFDPETSEFEYVLAESYDVSEDGMTWTFKIREGVKFHDGTDMTAEDVKFSIDRTMELRQGASYIWGAVNGVNVVDDYTVEFTLAYPAPLDLVASSPYASFIMSKDTVEANDDTWFEGGNEAGTGPYVLEDFTMGDEVILSQFTDYWKAWEGEHFEKILIKKVAETSSRRQLIEKGDATITMELPAEDVNALKDYDGVQVIVESSFTNMIGFFNTEKAPLDNENVRKALSYAFPYNDVVQYAAGGYAEQSTGPVPNNHWGHGQDLFQYSYNLDMAKQLLDAEGIKDGELNLLLTYMSGDEAEKKASELYKAELSKIGVNLEVRGMPWESQWEMGMNEDPEERQDIFLMYWWPDIANPYSWLYPLYRSEESPLFNLSYYKNAKFDNMIDAAYEKSSTDIDQASAEFIAAQEILIDDAASFYIYDKNVSWILDKNLRGFKNNPSYPWVVFFYDIYLEK